MSSSSMLTAQACAIQAELHAVEDAADLLAGFGRLTTALSIARVETRVPAKAGHQAMACVVQAQASVLAAREQVLQAHRACVRQGKIVLPEQAWGDEGDCPQAWADTTPAASPVLLRAVA